MKKKYIKLNDNYSHLSLGNIISAIKEESKNKISAIQSEVFCAIFNLDYINESTVNNYCIGSRSIGNDYKQIYIKLKKQYQKNATVFIDIIDNIISIVSGSIYDIKDIAVINESIYLEHICLKLYNISKNDFSVPNDVIAKFRMLLKEQDYYDLLSEMLIYAILEKKQPLLESERTKNVVETLLQNTDISVLDLQNFLLLELNEGINFSHSLRNLAKEGNPYANYHLAVMEYRGEFQKAPRYEKAYEYFLAAAKSNHPSAYWMLGNMITSGKVGSKKKEDYQKALTYFETSANLGNIAALNSLGLMYYEGLGVKKDIQKALVYFQKASDKNYVYALNNLGRYYEKEKKYEKAYEYFFRSANLNESYACNRVGEYLRNQKNYQEAFLYYNKSLESSEREKTPWAYYNLAKYYFLEGNLATNTPKNVDLAITYFENSQSLFCSLVELFYIYYERYQKEKKQTDLEKLYDYKNQIETHSDFNETLKKELENTCHKIKKKIEITLDL